MDGSGPGQASYAGLGQRDHYATPVRIGGGSPNDALIDQPGHTAGHARAGDERPRRQLRHPQLATGDRQLERGRACPGAYGVHSGVNKVLVIKREWTPDRITVVLVDEALGF